MFNAMVGCRKLAIKAESHDRANGRSGGRGEEAIKDALCD